MRYVRQLYSDHNWYASCLSVSVTPCLTTLIHRKEGDEIMYWAIMIVGTYVAGIYLIRLVWWQE
jgi:hypothetical protein